MADLQDKKSEATIKKMKVRIDQLEKQLELIYDSIVEINTDVVTLVNGFSKMYAIVLAISYIDLSNSNLSTSLDIVTLKMTNMKRNLENVKTELMAINGMECNINTTVNDVSDTIGSHLNEGKTNSSGWEKVEEIFFEKVIEVLVETLIKKLGDKSTRETISTWAKKIIESDEVKGALLSLSYMLPSYDDILVSTVNILGLIEGIMPKVSAIAIPTAVGVAGGYTSWRIHNEGIDLNSKIEEFGEEEGRIAAGTGLWDKAAIMQYDINKAKDSIEQIHTDMFASIGEKMGILYDDWTERMSVHQSAVQLTNDAITQTHVGMLTSVGERARILYESGTEKILLHQTNVQTSNEDMTQTYVNMFSKLREDVGGLYEQWGEKINIYQTDTKAANENITKSYVDMFTELGVKLKNWMDKEVLPIFSEENWTFASVGVGLSKSIESGINGITQGLNNFKNWVNTNFSISLNTNVVATAATVPVYGTIAKPNSLPTYEIGGFPEDGLFLANHGELVGQFSNGKTAVANNEQIVSGIKYGVREAVSEVLAPYLADIAQNTRETANKDFTTYIGDKEIARASERGRRAMGLQLITEY